MFLTFDEITRRLSFDVNITNDSTIENVENFSLELRFDPFGATPSNVLLTPNVSMVVIMDDDEAGIKCCHRS